MLRAYPTPAASTTAVAGVSSVNSPLIYSIILYVLYYIIYIINAVGARFIVFVPDFIASAPIFTPSPQGLVRLVSIVGGAGGSDNQLTAIPIAVGQGSGMVVMDPPSAGGAWIGGGVVRNGGGGARKDGGSE